MSFNVERCVFICFVMYEIVFDVEGVGDEIIGMFDDEVFEGCCVGHFVSPLLSDTPYKHS